MRSVTRDGILCVTRIDGTKGVRRYPEGRFSLCVLANELTSAFTYRRDVRRVNGGPGCRFTPQPASLPVASRLPESRFIALGQPSGAESAVVRAGCIRGARYRSSASVLDGRVVVRFFGVVDCPLELAG